MINLSKKLKKKKLKDIILNYVLYFKFPGNILISYEVVIIFSLFFYRSEKHDRLEDFSIAYEDIEFGDCLRVGRQRSIYR